MHAWKCIREPPWVSSPLRCHMLFFNCFTGPKQELGQPCWPTGPDDRLCFSSSGFTSIGPPPTPPAFTTGAGNENLGSQTDTAAILSTRPSPCPLSRFLSAVVLVDQTKLPPTNESFLRSKLTGSWVKTHEPPLAGPSSMPLQNVFVPRPFMCLIVDLSG